MQSKTIISNLGLFALTLLLMALLLYPSRHATAQALNAKDTVPAKAEKKVQDLDDALRQLQTAEKEVQQAMKNVDLDKVEKELQASMKNLQADMDKLQQELKEVNTGKIKQDLEQAMKELKAVDAGQMSRAMEEAMAKVDTEKIKAELQKVKETDFEKIKEKLEKIKPEMEQSLQKAKEDIEKAKGEIKEYQSFVDALEAEGIINKKEGYNIEIKESTLVVNGKEQPADVYNKHRAFLQKHKNTTIKKSGSDFNIYKD